MNETPEQVMKWFHAEVQRLSPVAAGSLSLRKSPCIRKNCPACASGVGHPSHALYGRRDGKRFSIYVPDELVPEVRDAIAFRWQPSLPCGLRNYEEAVVSNFRLASL